MSDKKNPSVGRSFRISQQYLNILNQEAEREGISLNLLVNRVLKNYCEYQRFFKRFGVVAITQKSFSRILEACPIGAIDDIAMEAGSSIALDLFRTMGLKGTFESVRFCITNIIAGNANWFEYERHVLKDKEIFHLRHNLGEKWSRYVAEMISTMVECLSGKKVKKEFADRVVTLEIPIF